MSRKNWIKKVPLGASIKAMYKTTHLILRLFLVLCLVSPVLLYSPRAEALGGLIRDAETENLIRDYASPIFQAANVASQNIRIHIIGDKSFNAFVIDGQNMFLHVGALINTKTPNALIGVIAHETGHITGGHLAGLRRQIARNQGVALVCQVVGILGTAAAIMSDSGGNAAQGGIAAIAGCGAALQRTMLSYRRAHEAAADQAALKYLNATKQSGLGMLETFEYFADQGLTSLKYIDPYQQSHPMPRDRLAQLRTLAQQSPYFNQKDSLELQLRHDLMKAKVTAYVDQPQIVFNKYPVSNTSLPAQYARAIALYQQGDLKAAIDGLDKLIAAKPGYAYFHEIKGQFLFEKGHAASAVPHLRKALQLAPKEQLIRILLSEAILASGNPQALDEVITNLKKAVVFEKDSATAYRLLAQAYGQKNMIGEARLASAHRYLYEGKIDSAKEQAKWAQTTFQRGSISWLQADDILNYRPPR